MRFAVITDNTAAVNRKYHGQFLQTDIVDYLVERTLQKSGINRQHRQVPLCG